MKDGHAGLLELVIRHRPVGRSEIDGLIEQLANPAAGADGLIVDLHVAVGLVVLIEPLRINRVGEGRSSGIQQDLPRAKASVAPAQQTSTRSDTFIIRIVCLLDFVVDSDS